MRKAFFLVCTLTALLITWYSCQKTSDTNPVPIDPTEIKVTASLRGHVTDENNKPVSGATVKSGSSETTTDINGMFRFDNIQLSRSAGFVTVEKQGYLKGSRTIFTNANALNNVEIQLIPKEVKGTFTATSAATIDMGGGSKVDLPANGIINASTNTAYTGTVTVSGTWLNPTDPKLHLIMPGNLTGVNTEGSQQQLTTFGMMAVELEGSGGEKLNLAPNKEATLKMPIPAALQATAPASIPLWYFDETKGLWMEEGSATKSGNEYIGTVSHFSFWNCDVPANFVQLKLVLKDEASQPLKFYKVKLTANNSSTYGFTDSTGVVRGPVPLNSPIAMEVYNVCNNSVHTQNIGPYTQSIEEIITIATSPSADVSLSGTITNCSGAPVTNGFAEIKIDGVIYRALTNSSGEYSITINRCQSVTSMATIIGGDIQANQMGGDTVMLSVTSGNYNVNAVRACGESIDQFVNFSINNGAIMLNWIYPTDSFVFTRSANINRVETSSMPQAPDWKYSTFRFDGVDAPGTYSVQQLSINNIQTIYYIQDGPANTTVTEFGAVGGYVAGTISGNLKDSLNSSAPIVPFTGNFRIKRKF